MKVAEPIQRGRSWWQEDEQGWMKWDGEKWVRQEAPPPPPVEEQSRRRRNFKRWWVIANVLLVLGIVGSTANLATDLQRCQGDAWCETRLREENTGPQFGTGMLVVGNAVAYGIWRSKFKS